MADATLDLFVETVQEYKRYKLQRQALEKIAAIVMKHPEWVAQETILKDLLENCGLEIGNK